MYMMLLVQQEVQAWASIEKPLQIILVHEDHKAMGEADPEEEQDWEDPEEEQAEGSLLAAHVSLLFIQGWNTPDQRI